MTLRFDERGKPAGLDWSSCTDGKPDPRVWRQPKEVAKALASCEAENNEERPERASTKRLSPAVERSVIHMYRDEQKSAIQVGKALGIQPATVFKVLNRNGVATRSRAESMQLSRTRRG